MLAAGAASFPGEDRQPVISVWPAPRAERSPAAASRAPHTAAGRVPSPAQPGGQQAGQRGRARHRSGRRRTQHHADYIQEHEGQPRLVKHPASPGRRRRLLRCEGRGLRRGSVPGCSGRGSAASSQRPGAKRCSQRRLALAAANAATAAPTQAAALRKGRSRVGLRRACGRPCADVPLRHRATAGQSPRSAARYVSPPRRPRFMARPLAGSRPHLPRQPRPLVARREGGSWL